MLFAVDTIVEAMKTWPGAAVCIAALLAFVALVYLINNPRKP